MRWAFSNLGFPHEAPAAWQLLREHGVTGIEVAPTRIWPNWQGMNMHAAREYRTKLDDAGFTVPALQAVLYARAEARLFDPSGERVFLAHMSEVARLAQDLGAPVVVWGAPKQRDRGTLSDEAAMEHLTPLLQQLAGVYENHDTCLCIEPNPRRYGCNFVVNAQEGLELVRRVDRKGFGLHLDAAGMFLEGDDLKTLWPTVGKALRHFHISEPDLGDFCAPQVPHEKNLDVLRKQRYQGWCSVEMREPKIPLAKAGPWPLVKKYCDAPAA